MFPEELMIAPSGQEKIFEMRPEYPFIIREVYPRQGKAMIAPWHWHEELEFIYVKEGVLAYSTPLADILVEKSNGIFVSSNVLHQILSQVPAAKVSYEVYMFRRNFLAEEGSLLDKKYISPLLKSASAVHLSESIPAHRKILESLIQLSELNSCRDFGYEIKSRNLMSEVWLTMTDILKVCPSAGSSASFLKEGRLKEMLLYIQEHYMDEISLANISAAANISPREGLRCFQEGLHTTPFAYLRDCRIRAACSMLQNTSDKITEIALKCGFSSSSYFGKIFRRQMNCTPHEYRNLPSHSLSNPA